MNYATDIDISQIDSWPKAIVAIGALIFMGFVVWCITRVFY